MEDVPQTRPTFSVEGSMAVSEEAPSLESSAVSAVSADVPDWAVSLEAASFVLPELHAAKHSSSKHTVRMRQSIFFISSVSPFVSFCGCTAATDYSIIQNRHDQV